jgi:1-acyl-sn-glycerol-3-phosphate acyltransferase
MNKAKLTHRSLWYFVKYTYAIYLRKLFRVKVKWHKKPPKNGGFLLVANHSNKHDPFIIGGYLFTPVNYMANVDGVGSFQKAFSKKIGCFNIKKGRADKSAFIEAINLLKNGYTVGIFPEGDRNWLGETGEFSSVTVSLAKKTNKPILMARSEGNHFSCPRWSDKPRRGNIFIEFDVISESEVKAMSKDEIYKRIYDFIYTDDFENKKLSNIEYKGKDLAVGIENILWRCPNCNTEDKLYGEKDDIVCKSCNTHYRIDGNLRVFNDDKILTNKNIKTVKDWYNWQISFMNKEQFEFMADSDVEFIKEIEENVWESLGKGTLKLTKQGLTWNENNGKYTFLFTLDEIMNIVDNFNQYSLLNLTTDRYKLFTGNTCSFKWTTQLNKLKE